jgi:hypothetical protein
MRHIEDLLNGGPVSHCRKKCTQTSMISAEFKHTIPECWQLIYEGNSKSKGNTGIFSLYDWQHCCSLVIL